MARIVERWARLAKGGARSVRELAPSVHKGVKHFRKAYEAASPHLKQHGCETSEKIDRAVRGGLSAYDHLSRAARDVARATE